MCTLETRTRDNRLKQILRAGGHGSCEVCVHCRGCVLHRTPLRLTTEHLNHRSELLLPLQIPIRAISDISCLQQQFHVERCRSRSYRIVHKSQQQIPASGDMTVTSTKTEGCGNKVNAVTLSATTAQKKLSGLKRKHSSGSWHHDVQIVRTLSTDGKTAVIFLVAGS